jgi:hypothetical protein
VIVSQEAPKARQKVARGKRLCAPPQDQTASINRALKGRNVFLRPFRALMIKVGVIQGLRKALPLATFCRASGAS